MNNLSVFQSAIRDKDGEVDTFYLAGYVTTMLVLGIIPWMAIGAAIAAWCAPDHHFDAAALGAGVRDVCVGFGAVMAGGGFFKLGDKDKPKPEDRT